MCPFVCPSATQFQKIEMASHHNRFAHSHEFYFSDFPSADPYALSLDLRPRRGNDDAEEFLQSSRSIRRFVQLRKVRSREIRFEAVGSRPRLGKALVPLLHVRIHYGTRGERETSQKRIIIQYI